MRLRAFLNTDIEEDEKVLLDFDRLVGKFRYADNASAFGLSDLFK